MNKINLILIIVAALLTATGTYYYAPFDIDYIQWGISAAAFLITLLFYVLTRKRTKSKAAATAIRKSAGNSGVRKWSNKLMTISLVAIVSILVGTKCYQLLIPMGVTVVAYVLFRLFKIKLFLLISFVATFFAAILFETLPNLPIMEEYKLIAQVLTFMIFAFYLIPSADQYCIGK